MINRLLYALSAGLPCRLITLDSGPYLERYYVGTLFGVTFYLHRFVSSDSERHMHNHPWGWGRALVLAGRYWEESVADICPAVGPEGAILNRRWVRWWNRVNGNSFHRISSAAPGTWTLFFHGPRLDITGAPMHKQRHGVLFKGWGFLESGPQNTTVFRQTPPSPRRWWRDALPGCKAGRVPL